MTLLAAESASGALSTVLMVLLSSAITENILLTRFLGMCPFLSISKQLKSAAGMGLAVIVVLTGTCVINYLLYVYVLAPLADRGVPAESLKLIMFIITIAGFVQLMEMVIERLSLKLYYALGIFLPLITVNCAILGASLFMVNNVQSKGFGLLSVTAYGLGAGGGWALAILLMAGIRLRLQSAKISPALEGPAITLIIAGIMALAFVGLQGMIRL
ncbi:MAG: Rnf-Nqr domain containing protein [Planctomycetaceae bacterium]|nr:NADH:ubiquinone reductase (Na(+)-transporting) subunit E [Planctomycetaceae bacterium]